MADVIEQYAAEKKAFAERCQKDVDFATKVLAAVLEYEETSAAFHAELKRLQQTTYVSTGLNWTYSKFTYNQGSIANKPLISISNKDGLPEGCGANQTSFTLICYDGEWSGMLVEAAKLLKYLPLGLITTALIQALFGTKVGAMLLALFLII